MAAVTASTCVGIIQTCAQRFAALTNTGAPSTGTNGYQTNVATEIKVTPQVEDGTTAVLKNACGSICQTFEDCDRLSGIEIELSVCSYEPDLTQLLIGGRKFTTSSITQGIEFPLPTDACNNGTSFEFWTLAWDNDTQATTGGALLYNHWVAPRVLWQLSDFTIQGDDFTVFKFTGKAKTNPRITANGPFDDWPTTSGVVAAGGITGLMGVFYDQTTLPVASCSLVSVPSAGS